MLYKDKLEESGAALLWHTAAAAALCCANLNRAASEPFPTSSADCSTRQVNLAMTAPAQRAGWHSLPEELQLAILLRLSAMDRSVAAICKVYLSVASRRNPLSQ